MPRKKLTLQGEAPSKVRHDDEILWVAEQLSTSRTTRIAMAPSNAAWALYEWAADPNKPEHRTKFWTQMFKAVATKDRADRSQLMVDDQRKFFRLYSMLELERPELRNDEFPPDTCDIAGTITPGVEDSTVPDAPAVESCLVPDCGESPQE